MPYTQAAPYLLIAVALAIAFFLGRAMWREWKTAIGRDNKEETTKYTRQLMVQYAIIIGVCVVAFVVVRYGLRDTLLAGISHRLYGGGSLTLPATADNITPLPFPWP